MPDQTTPKPAVFKINGRPLPYELHPACAAWPLMPMEALRELAADIKANGLRDRLTLTPDGLLLEGQNRMTACALNGDFNPPTEVYEGDDPVGFVISKNKHRRHMDATALAFVAASLVTLRHGGDRRSDNFKPANAGLKDQAKPAAAVAAEIGIPVTSVENARAVLDKGTPEVAAVVQRERLPLRKAADYVRHVPKDKQVADPAVIRQAARPAPRPALNPRAPARVRHAADFIATHTAEEIEAEIAAGAAAVARASAAREAREAAQRASIEALATQPQAAPQPSPSLSAEERRQIADQRPLIIMQLMALLSLDTAGTLDDLVRLIRVNTDITTLPQPTRIALARGFLHALGLSDADLRPLT